MVGFPPENDEGGGFMEKGSRRQEDSGGGRRGGRGRIIVNEEWLRIKDRPQQHWGWPQWKGQRKREEEVRERKQERQTV